MPCTICDHPKRQEIDQALLAGSTTLAALNQEYNLSTSALQRHKAHLQAQVSRGRDRLLDNLRQGCLFWLTQALEMIMATARTAQAEGDGKLVLKALAQGTRFITIILKNNLPLDDRTVYELLTSPQWTSQSGFLPHDPAIMAQSRQSLQGFFASPCAAGADLPDTPLSADDLALMSHLFQGLAASESPDPACRPPREKGGKSPGKSPHPKENSQKCQEDKLWKKISGIMAASPLARPLPGGAKRSKFDSILQELAEADKKPADQPLADYLHEQSLKNGHGKPDGLEKLPDQTLA